MYWPMRQAVMRYGPLASGGADSGSLSLWFFQNFSGMTGSVIRLSMFSLPGLAKSMRTVSGAMAFTVVPL